MEQQDWRVQECLDKMRKYLEKLEAMPILPKAGSPEAMASHKAWMQAHEEIKDIVQCAELTAMWTVPPEVAALMDSIRNRSYTLFNIGSVQKVATDAEEDRLERQVQTHLEAAALHRDDPMF